MIFGIGTDIIRIDRIAAAVARHGDRFAQRIDFLRRDAELRRDLHRHLRRVAATAQCEREIG